jgi:hypothetical protein
MVSYESATIAAAATMISFLVAFSLMFQAHEAVALSPEVQFPLPVPFPEQQ